MGFPVDGRGKGRMAQSISTKSVGLLSRKDPRSVYLPGTGAFTIIPSQYAFTLIEVLVVTMIVSIMAGILLPALKSARETGRTIECVNTESQLTLAMMVYLDDSNTWFPGYMIWYDSLIGEGYLASDTGRYSADTYVALDCATKKGEQGWETDYNFNACLSGFYGFPRRLVQVRSTSRILMFADNNKNTYYTCGYTGYDYGFFGYWHKNQSNYAFCDGHVETFPRMDIEADNDYAKHPDVLWGDE